MKHTTRSFASKERKKTLKEIWRDREFYVILIPGILLALLFQYVPMYGELIAFKNVRIGQGFSGDWVGLDNFFRLFSSGQFVKVLKNTLTLNILVLICTVPIPVFMALLLHNAASPRIKKLAQTATYLPHLLSMVILISLMNLFCNGEFGLINIVRRKMDLDSIQYFGSPKYVIPLYIISAIWKSTGYSAIVYLSALTSIDQSVVEASTIDGCDKLARIWYIDLRLISSTVVTMLILNLGKIMTISNMDKILLMQTPLNLDASETLATYVYKVGITKNQYGFATAVDLFNKVCNLIILFTSNWVSKKISGTGMF